MGQPLGDAIIPLIPVLPVVQAWAKDFCPPLWWDEPEAENDADRRKVGTVCLVDTGERLIGITAGHVHNQLVARLKSGTSRWCQLGNHTFDPKGNLIALDRGLDLATYAISDIVFSASGHFSHKPLKWPPDLPVEGEICALGGHPYRLSTDKPGKPSVLTTRMQREHKFLTVFCRVSDVHKTAISCEAEPEGGPAWTKDSLPKGTPLDGMSGGPLLRFLQLGSVSTFALAGVIVKQLAAGPGIVSRPLTVVRADGHLEPSR